MAIIAITHSFLHLLIISIKFSLNRCLCNLPLPPLPFPSSLPLYDLAMHGLAMNFSFLSFHFHFICNTRYGNLAMQGLATQELAIHGFSETYTQLAPVVSNNNGPYI